MIILRTMLVASVLALLTVTPVQAASQSEIEEAISVLKSSSGGLVERFSDSEVKQMLVSAGYKSVRVIDDGKLRFKVGEQVFVLYIHEDGDMHLYYGSTGLALSYEDINEWNRTTRLSRAYLDDDDDIAIETDLLANAGINQTMVLEMVKVFVETSVPRFIDFVRENDRS